MGFSITADIKRRDGDWTPPLKIKAASFSATPLIRDSLPPDLSKFVAQCYWSLEHINCPDLTSSDLDHTSPNPHRMVSNTDATDWPDKVCTPNHSQESHGSSQGCA